MVEAWTFAYLLYRSWNIFSYGLNLNIEIGGSDTHFKKIYKILQKVIESVIDKLLTWNLVNRVTMRIPSAMLNKIYENITCIKWRPFWKIMYIYIYISQISWHYYWYIVILILHVVHKCVSNSTCMLYKTYHSMFNTLILNGFLAWDSFLPKWVIIIVICL